MAAIVSDIKKANTPVVHAPVVANPVAKAKISEVLKGLNKGQAPAPSPAPRSPLAAPSQGSVERILRPSAPNPVNPVNPVKKSAPKKIIPPDPFRKPPSVFKSKQDEWIEEHPESVTAKKVKTAAVKRTAKASAKAAAGSAIEERIVRAERAMKDLPEGVRRAISRLHEQVRVNPTKGGRDAASATLAKVLDKHGLTKGHLLSSRLRVLALAPALAPRERRVNLLDRGDQALKTFWPPPDGLPNWWRGRVPAMPARGTKAASLLAEELRTAHRRPKDIFGKLARERGQKIIKRGVPGPEPATPITTWVNPTRPQQLRFLLSERLERFTVQQFNGSDSARATPPTNQVQPLNREPPFDRLRTVPSSAEGLNLRNLVEFMSLKKALPAAGMAAVEMLPGGTAINAAGLAGVRTGVHLRRILRTRYGGLTNAAMQVQPLEAVGIMGEAAGTGVRDSRAFLRKTVRNLPRPVSRALNKRVFSALPLASFATLARDSAPIRLRVDTGTYLMSRRRNEEPPQGFDRWLRRASYAAAPVAAAGSVAVLLKSRKIVPSAQRAIDEWHSVAKKAGDAVSQVQSVADQVSRSPSAGSGLSRAAPRGSRFLPKAAKPGEIGRALAR
ncbi:MAG: hypothetical protein ACOYMV_13255, partial [Verrucomicrobiia bacterium]